MRRIFCEASVDQGNGTSRRVRFLLEGGVRLECADVREDGEHLVFTSCHETLEDAATELAARGEVSGELYDRALSALEARARFD